MPAPAGDRGACGVFHECRWLVRSCGLVGRHTGFRFTVDASPAQVAVLARHAGAARFAFSQCLALVKQALDARVAAGRLFAVLRRVLIAIQYQAAVPGQPTPDEIRAVHLAWAQAAG